MAKIDKTPIYRFPAACARENGELGQYHASRKLNRACKEAIESAIREHFDGMHLSKAAAAGVLKQFSPERVTYVLANTVQQQDWDERFSSSNKSWARTIPMYVPERERDDCRVTSHPYVLDGFIDMVRREIRLREPLKAADIKAEASHILTQFQNAREPDSPDGMQFKALISDDFLARAKPKDRERLAAMLPFQSLSFSELEGRRGTYALISQNENRFQPLRLRKPSVRKKLQERADVSKPSGRGRTKEQER